MKKSKNVNVVYEGLPPEDDPNSEGYSYVENSHGYCLLTVMFNRIIDVDEITAVVINGTELPMDN